MPLTPDETAMHRFRVDRLMRNKARESHDRGLDVYYYIMEHEVSVGTSFLSSIDGSIYIFLGQINEIHQLPPIQRAGSQVTAYLNSMYGLSMTMPLGKFIYSNLRDHAVATAPRLELRRFSVFNAVEKVTYLSSYDGRMWRFDGGTPTRISNGDEDVFFADDDGGVSIEPNIGPHGILFDTLTNLNFCDVGIGGILPHQQRQAIIVWLFALAFPDFMVTKPLLMIEGGPGSGKTTAIQIMQFTLMGSSAPMILSKKVGDDFGVLLLRSPLAMFDNADTYLDWIPDAVCSYTTSGTFKKRKLFTDSDEVVIKPHAFIAVAAKNPASFRREDTADRTLVIRLERRGGFKPMNQIELDILALRPQLLGEYMYYVNQIVDYLRVHGIDIQGEGSTRMADFAAFSRAVAAVLHWPAETVDELMEALAKERDAFIREDDPLSTVLTLWLKMRRNIGREVGLGELFDELDTVAKSNKILFYKTARTLHQKMRSPHIEREFHVETILCNGNQTFRFWKRDQPKLAILNGGPDESPNEPGGSVITLDMGQPS